MIGNIPFWVYPLVAWTLIWKGMGLWKAARKGQLKWFISLIVFNTAGVLPMVYLFWFSKESKKKKKKKSKKIK